MSSMRARAAACVHTHAEAHARQVVNANMTAHRCATARAHEALRFAAACLVSGVASAGMSLTPTFQTSWSFSGSRMLTALLRETVALLVLDAAPEAEAPVAAAVVAAANSRIVETSMAAPISKGWAIADVSRPVTHGMPFKSSSTDSRQRRLWACTSRGSQPSRLPTLKSCAAATRSGAR
eukprot:5885568-Pleurochrysis_carterae.AAC.1